MKDIIWKTWNEDWLLMLSIVKSRNWSFLNLDIANKTTFSKIDSLEREINTKYPSDFVEVLLNYSESVKFGWQIAEGEEELDGFPIWGCGGISEYTEPPYLWDINKLKNVHASLEEWKTNCYNDPNDSYGKHYYEKVPFREINSGDFLVFNPKGEVVYLSHDDGPLHGHKIADNFVEFITIWSSLGCVGPNDDDLSLFYDYNLNKFVDNNSNSVKWKNWLIKK